MVLHELKACDILLWKVDISQSKFVRLKTPNRNGGSRAMPRPPASIRNSGNSSRPRLVNREQPTAQTTSGEPEASPTSLFPEEETGSANLEEQAALGAFRRGQARAEAEASH